MKTITPPKGVKTAKLWKNKAPENKALKYAIVIKKIQYWISVACIRGETTLKVKP